MYYRGERFTILREVMPTIEERIALKTLGILAELLGYAMFALAVLHALKKARDKVERLVLLLSGGLYGWLLEEMGVIFFNAYSYPKPSLIKLHVVPAAVVLGWAFIIYACIFMAEEMGFRRYKIPLMTSIFALNLDFGIDAIATKAGFWRWEDPASGIWYGVPASNFLSWLLAPLIFTFIYSLHYERGRIKIVKLTGLEDSSWARKLFSLICVAPISAFGMVGAVILLFEVLNVEDLIGYETIAAWLVLNNLFLIYLTVAKRRKLIASRWYDFIPSLALIIAYLVYITIGLSLGEVLLSLIAFFTSLPVLLRLVFLYLNREEKE